MDIPYASATSGSKAREEIVKLLKHFECSRVGFMDEFETHTLILQFEWRGIPVTLKASAQGWANAYLKEHPYTHRTRGTQRDYELKWLRQGEIAVNSILRDWVKGQVTAVETGILTFEQVFMPYMMLPSGKSVLEHLKQQKLLPQLESE